MRTYTQSLLTLETQPLSHHECPCHHDRSAVHDGEFLHENLYNDMPPYALSLDVFHNSHRPLPAHRIDHRLEEAALRASREAPGQDTHLFIERLLEIEAAIELPTIWGPVRQELVEIVISLAFLPGPLQPS